MQEDDALIWSLYGSMAPRKRLRLLRTLRRRYAADLTDAEAEVTALKHRLLILDNALADYVLIAKQGG
jgi:hypothetical protein